MSRPYSEFQNENSPDITIQNTDKKQSSLSPDDLKPNTPHVLLFMSVMTSCTLALRLHAGSQVYPLIAAKFGWTSKDEFESKLRLFALVIICTGVSGVALGTYLMRFGRRFAMRVGVSFAFIGGCIMLYLVWPIHLWGVAIMEVGNGMMIVTKARMI